MRRESHTPNETPPQTEEKVSWLRREPYFFVNASPKQAVQGL